MGIEFFDKGGWVMYVLALLSVYALAVTCYKIYQFVNAGIFDRSFIDPAIKAIGNGDVNTAKSILGKAKGPIARIMQVSLDCVSNREMLQSSREAEISRIGSADIRYLESHMRGLEMVANVGPLLGLFGTVIGMVDAFAQLETAGTRVDPSLLAGGIWVALLTTVGGLAVAIPAVAVYYIFDGIIERVRGAMKDTTIQIMMLEDQFQRNEREFKRKQAQERAEQRKREEENKKVEERQRAEEERKLEEARAEQRKREEEQRLREMAESMRSSPQSSSTLRLLNPRYSQF
jgi:biopolymer transport protein ExbB